MRRRRLRRRGWLGLALLGTPIAGGAMLAGCSGTDLAAWFTDAGGSIERAGLTYGPLARHRVDVTMPAGPARARVVFIYGGGWDSGERGRYRFLARTLAAAGVAVAIPDYRLWPEARWPDFLEDAALAVRWASGPDFGGDSGPGRSGPETPAPPLFVAGHSAGGFIAVALALDQRWLGPERLALAGVVGLAGVYEFRPTDEPVVSIFATAPGGLIRAAPEDADLAVAPPLLLLHGEADTTVRREQSRRLAARVTEAGGRATLTIYPGVGHIGIVAALAGPIRALGLAGGPVREDLLAFFGAT